MDYDFFISYSHEDSLWAEWIAWQLEDAGYRTVLASADFVPGENFVHKMDQLVQAARHVITVLSPAYLDSPHKAAEWSAALARDPTNSRASIIPVRVQPFELTEHYQLTGLLAGLVYIDLVGLTEDQAGKALLSALPKPRRKAAAQAEYPKSALRGVFLGPQPQTPHVLETVKRSLPKSGGELVKFDFGSATAVSANRTLDEMRKCDFVIADISRANPNVMFELGFASALSKPVLILVDESSVQTGIPSDLVGYSLVTYSSDSLNEEVLAKSISHFLRQLQ